MNEIRLIEKISDRLYVCETDPEPFECSEPDCTDCGGVATIWLFDLALRSRTPFASIEAARVHVSELEER